jgi:hypothetical protein
MVSDTPFDDETNAALLENQRQRVAVSRRLLAAHKAGDIETMQAAQVELSGLCCEAVEIQCAGMRRAQGAA